LSYQAQGFNSIAEGCVANRTQCAEVELRLATDAIRGCHPPLQHPTTAHDALTRHADAHNVTLTPTAVAMTLMTNSATNEYTTVSLTALPTPAGPPPTEMPL
jgi:hypothetical protein